jgi:hypothetical protein
VIKYPNEGSISIVAKRGAGGNNQSARQKASSHAHWQKEIALATYRHKPGEVEPSPSPLVRCRILPPPPGLARLRVSTHKSVAEGRCGDLRKHDSFMQVQLIQCRATIREVLCESRRTLDACSSLAKWRSVQSAVTQSLGLLRMPQKTGRTSTPG